MAPQMLMISAPTSAMKSEEEGELRKREALRAMKGWCFRQAKAAEPTGATDVGFPQGTSKGRRGENRAVLCGAALAPGLRPLGGCPADRAEIQER